MRILSAAARKMRHGLDWRREHYGAKLKPWMARMRVWWNWHMPFRSKTHGLGKPVVLSLTSYPPRFATLHLTLMSLLRQTMKADHAILWIAPQDMAHLPGSVTRLKACGLEIRQAEDTKSYKKILPALDAFPDAYICTADDDLYYWPTWLEELVEGTKQNPDTIACHRAHEITFTADGGFRPYQEWTFNTKLRGRSDVLFPTSGGGILYPPGILAHSPEDREAILACCPDADDVALYWITRRNGAGYATIGRPHEIVAWPGSQAEALWRGNVLEEGNDKQIKAMIGKFGDPNSEPVSRTA